MSEPAESRVYDAHGEVTKTYALAPTDGPLPTGDVLVALSRLLAGDVGQGGEGRRVGVVLQPEDDVRALAPWLGKLALVCVTFPSFREGRPFTQARLLREELSWRGPIRALGSVTRDRLFFMHRCGITEFALSPDVDVEGALAGLRDFTVTYQAMPAGPASRARDETA